ncbi:MAG: SPOR domain-containing protein [Betaproteobacteria bacterium]|jgi:Cell division protein|nr:SPOR domain-containing protein [Betaproteobacteria bacterium]
MSSKPNSPAVPPKNRFFIGLMAGLVFGSLLAAGIALYISHLASPMPTHSATPTISPIAEGHTDANKRGLLTPSSLGTAVSSPDPMSEGNSSATDGNPTTAPIQSTPTSLPSLPEAGPPLPPPNLPSSLNEELHPVTVRYFIQTGAFSQASEAESQRANLALLGIDSTVIPSEPDGKSPNFRVRVGPFASVEEVRSMVKTLRDNAIPSQVLRETTTSHSSLVPH